MFVSKQIHAIDLLLVWKLMKWLSISWVADSHLFTLTLKETYHSPRHSFESELDSSKCKLFILLQGLRSWKKNVYWNLKLKQKGKEQQGAYNNIHRVVGKGHLFHDLWMQKQSAARQLKEMACQREKGCQGKLSKGKWMDDDCWLLYELSHFIIIGKYCLYYLMTTVAMPYCGRGVMTTTTHFATHFEA